MQKLIYGKTAYEGFARAMASRLGLSVQIVDGSRACINQAGVISMPGMNTFQTPEEFEVTCGVIIHEMAHQFYGSHGQINPANSKLYHDCLNAVLDVADETWVSEWFVQDGNGRPSQLLTQANRDALHKGHKALQDWDNADTHCWKVLCVGILSARLGRLVRWVRFTSAKAGKLGVDAKACFRLLRRARLAKLHSPRPTIGRFRLLRKLASELADLLKPFAPPDSAPMVGISIVDALGAGRKTVPANYIEADANSGAKLLQDDNAAAAGGSGAGGGKGSGKNGNFDQHTFNLLLPAIHKIAQRIAIDGDGYATNDGLCDGPRIGQAYRLLTDGNCLARWNENENADGVAVSVILDCSGSMHKHLPQCAGIARAFALAMRQAGKVQSLAFGDSVEPSNDFEVTTEMGTTSTHRAIDEADKFLSKQNGKRWIVIITDGTPDNPMATDAACQAAITKGINILAIGLGKLVPMPGICVVAENADHLAIELEAAGQRIEQGG